MTVSLTGSGVTFQDGSTISPSGSAPTMPCRSWTRFNSSSGSPVIVGSNNVSSIGDLGTGVFQMNFATAMSDNLFTTVGTAARAFDSSGYELYVSPHLFNASYTGVHQNNSGAGKYDSPVTCIMVFK